MKRLVVGGAVAALAIGGLGLSQAAPAQYKVTGGGQLFLTDDEGAAITPDGPGQTLAFNAHSAPTAADTDAARGQLQFNSHLGEKFHGEVDCLVVMWEDVDDDEDTPEVRTARVAGTYSGAEGDKYFQLYIEDHDFGGPQNGDELIGFDSDADDNTCDQDGDVTSELGRGNIVIHKEKPASKP